MVVFLQEVVFAKRTPRSGKQVMFFFLARGRNLAQGDVDNLC